MNKHRGELVILRAYGDQPLLRRIWSVDEQGITILSEERYQYYSNRGSLLDDNYVLRWQYRHCYQYSEKNWGTAEQCYQLSLPFWDDLPLWSEAVSEEQQ